MSNLSRGCAWIVLSILAAAGRAAAQCQVSKLVPSSSAQGDRFGSYVAIDGDWAVVGAPLNDDVGLQAGAAFVFHRVFGTWIETQKLTASDGAPSDTFGQALAISGNTIVIGAPLDSHSGVFTAGSVYAFERVGEAWVERAKLTASDATSNAVFGCAVAISDDRVVIGSYSASPASLYSGEAYVFERSGSTWVQTAILVPSDVMAGDALGASVAIEGDRVLVGAPTATVTPSLRSGAVWYYERTNQGSWVQRQKLLGSNPVTGDGFGTTLGISGNTVLVGAFGRNTAGGHSGAAYFFELQGSTWAEQQEVVGLDSAPNDGFGGWGGLCGDVAVLASASDQDAGFNTGSAYAFVRAGSVWNQSGKLLANDAMMDDLFGMSIGLSGRTVIVGSPYDDDFCPQNPNCNSGSAYIFELAPTSFQYGSCATGAPCGNVDAHGGCVNSTGQGAILQACGSGSAVTDDLVLEVRHLPPGTSGILYMGAGQMNAPFGNGQRVVASGGLGLFRFGVQQADAAGVLRRGPGIVAQSQGFAPAGHITAGQSWNFQCWFRNPAGPCGAPFSLSNGLRVDFTP